MLNANVVDEGGESNDEGGVEHYQHSDNADSPTNDSGVDDDDDDDDTAGKKRREKRERNTLDILNLLLSELIDMLA